MSLAQHIEEAWPKAQRYWSSFLLMSEPVDKPEAIAQIDLATRQVSLHGQLIEEKHLHDTIEALLAHEVGHHVRYPGSLATQARLCVLEKQVLPFEGYSLINLFTDLMINERLGHDLKEQFIKLYTVLSTDLHVEDKDAQWKRNPAFLFYMAVYEELWRLNPGRLMGPPEAEFSEHFRGYRSEAQVLAQDLFNLGPNLFTQFLYFLSVFTRYVEPIEGEDPEHNNAHNCGVGDPSPEDWAEALSPNAKEREAIQRALREGWLDEVQAERLTGEQSQSHRLSGVPGFRSVDASLVPEVMAAYYRREAEKYLLRPPKQRAMGEAVVPTTLEPWSPQDPVQQIDWRASLNTLGETLGTATPLIRSRVAEHEGHDVTLWQPRMELYLDVSGSMPDPRYTRNAMTLAAQILCAATIRAGGWFRAVLYSTDAVEYWSWCRSELEISRFLMHYIGGGTCFPWQLLERSLQERNRADLSQPIRVVISDTDFDRNYDAQPAHAAVFANALRASDRFVLLQHYANPQRVKQYRALGAIVVEVPLMDDFPKMARELAFALFDEVTHG